MMELNEQEQAIVGALSQFAMRAYTTDLLIGPTLWTAGVMKCMADLGRTRGNKICVSGGHGDEPEWLFDLVWFKDRGTGLDLRVTSIPLAMECEWNRYGIAEDFEKLLQTNADTRLMVCAINSDSYREDMLNYYRESIEGFEQGRSGDRFLIVNFRDGSKDVQVELIVK